VDPLAGSHFIESLTAEVEKEANALIAQIDEMGGSVTAIEKGFIQNEIARSAYAYQKAIESSDKIIVGVNKFTTEEQSQPPVFKVDASVQERQMAKVKAVKENRDQAKAKACLNKIKAAAAGTENLMPHVLDAVEHHCTLGEISDVLREQFGEYKG
jgi:methylmalonyl-CoA mutase N-terminal domain/subunit